MSRLLKVASVFLFLPKLDMWGLEKLPKDVESSFYAGVHEVVGCEGCHLPGLPDRISRSEIPTNCGDCHPDQHDDYTISVHAEGDRPAAVCTDCHGLHGIKRVRQPDSKVHRSLVCASCHIGPGEEFEKGPHSSAMEKSGAPACASCHGNHAVKRPTIAVVEPACEVCHTSESSPFQFGQQVESLLASFRDSLVATRQRTDRANAANLNVHAPEVLLSWVTRLYWMGIYGVYLEASRLKLVGITFSEVEVEMRAHCCPITHGASAWCVSQVSPRGVFLGC